tara:strand:+ start:369 stop:590 length:222 start_codon:yes stop_codon:yes gene_type:complete
MELVESMIYTLRYLDKFSARAGNHNWVSDSIEYSDDNVFERLDDLQELGYLVELSFKYKVKKDTKEVDLNPIF